MARVEGWRKMAAAGRRLRCVARHIVGAASATPPSPLPITADELPELVRMVDANLGSGVLEDTGSTFLTSHPRVYLPENLRNIFAIRVDGEIAAEVPYYPWRVRLALNDPSGPELGLGFISPTATRADHRQKGYGLQCLRACLRQMEELDGCELSALNTLVTTFYFYERECALPPGPHPTAPSHP